MKMLGRKHRPFYRICAIHRSKGRDAPEIEELGTYDPMVAVKSERVKLNLERVDYWLSVGATPSEKVATLIKKVRGNKFGTAKAPPPMTPPKAPPPPPEAAPAAEGEGESAPPGEGS
jgi:small subunit ribosomal protein S16